MAAHAALVIGLLLLLDGAFTACPSCEQTCPCATSSTAGAPTCLPYDNRYFATSIDEAMFSFPNLATYDGQPLFDKQSSYGGSASASAPQAIGPRARIASVPSADSAESEPAAFAAAAFAPAKEPDASPEFMSCKLSIVNGFLQNAIDENDSLWNTKTTIEQQTGLTEGYCGTASTGSATNSANAGKTKNKKQKSTFTQQNQKQVNQIIGILSTMSRKKRDTGNSTSDQPDTLGVTNQIGCDYKRGTSLDRDSTWCGLCNLCWQWRKLPDDYFPNFINEVSCDKGDNGCLAGFGECNIVTRSLDVLRNVGTKDSPNWQQQSIDVAAACECQVQIGNPIHAFVSK